MIRKVLTGWQVDVRIKGVRKRKTFAKKVEAQAYLTYIKANLDSPWASTTGVDHRKLADLVDLWFQVHGQNLKAGKKIHQQLTFLAYEMGNPDAHKVTKSLFVNFRQYRLSKGLSANSVNHDLAYLRGMFSALTKTGNWNHANPLQNIPVVKQKPFAAKALSINEIQELMSAMEDNLPLKLVVSICLATGARWSEANKLAETDIDFNKNIISLNGKNGKYRHLPIPEFLANEISQYILLMKQYGLYNKKQIFPSSYNAFRYRVRKLSKVNLPTSQLTHILRHTFAAHYLTSTKDIKSLQIILDHASLSTTSKYAHHTNPAHFQMMLDNSPLAKLNEINKI